MCINCITFWICVNLLKITKVIFDHKQVFNIGIKAFWFDILHYNILTISESTYHNIRLKIYIFWDTLYIKICTYSYLPDNTYIIQIQREGITTLRIYQSKEKRIVLLYAFVYISLAYAGQRKPVFLF